MKFNNLKKSILLVYLSLIIVISIEAKAKATKEDAKKAVDPPVSRRVSQINKNINIRILMLLT
jgi:hypothetical protein